MTKNEHELSYIISEIINASENMDFKYLRYLHLNLSIFQIFRIFEQ